MTRKPNLNSLRMFDAAARHGSFRAAADQLNLTQGAVSGRVRELEAELCTLLFHREARGLSLTEAGRNYHKAVQRALAIIHQATDKLLPQPSRIVLSVTPSFAAKWLVPRLTEFSQLHPYIDLQTEASENLSDVTGGGADIAIRLGAPPQREGVVSQLFLKLELCAVCSPDFARTIQRINSVEDLFKHSLVQDSHNRWEELGRRIGKIPDRRIQQLNHTSLAIDSASSGQGLALAPRLLVETDIARGNLVEMWRDPKPNPQGYYVLHSHAPNAARDTVIEWLVSMI